MSPAIARKLSLADRAQAHADEAAEFRTRCHALEESLRSLVAHVSSVGGYTPVEAQNALQRARALLGLGADVARCSYCGGTERHASFCERAGEPIAAAADASTAEAVP